MFLYIQDESQKWFVCIGDAYAKHICRVGYASEKMVHTKQPNTRQRRSSSKLLGDVFFSIAIEPTRTISILNYASQMIFDKIERNKKAIFRQGLVPLNKEVLLITDVQKP